MSQQHTVDGLLDAIRNAASLEDLQCLAGPSEAEQQAAKKRLLQMEDIALNCEFESLVPSPKADVGEGWMRLPEGEKLLPGDGFFHTDYNGWIDFECRADIFRGDSQHVHSGWPWRRRSSKADCLGGQRT